VLYVTDEKPILKCLQVAIEICTQGNIPLKDGLDPVFTGAVSSYAPGAAE